MNKKLNYISTIQFLYPYIKKFKKNFMIFFFGWFFDMILTLVIPVIFGIMIDEIVYYQNVDTFIRLSLIFVVMTILSCLLYFFIYAQHHYIMSMFVFHIKNDLFHHYQMCNAKSMYNMRNGDVITLLQKHSKECMHFVTRNMVHLLICAICILCLSSYLLLLNWKFGLIVLTLTPLTLYINTKFGRKIRKNGAKQRDIYNTYTSWLYEMLASITAVRLLGAKQWVFRKFNIMHKEMYHWSNEASLLNIVADFFIQLANLLVQLVIYIFAGYLAFQGNLTIGSLTVVLSFYTLLKSRMKQGSSNFLDAQMRISYIQQIYDFMQIPEEKDEWSGRDNLTICKGEIVLKNVSFQYSNNDWVLNSVSLHIGSNEKIALVGMSGSGKSTLAYMLAGFYRPDNGSIEIDGQNLQTCSLKSIRQQIGIIQQDVLLFDGTIRDNLLLGNRHAVTEELEKACLSAGIWEFIKTLPDGLETKLGEDGMILSGGQKQRIAIARIYLKDPKIIIFDEATSALDNETEVQILKEWSKMLAGRTAIIIAHRVTSVMICDNAVILENGHVCEIGKPEDLKRKSSRFKELFEGGEAI